MAPVLPLAQQPDRRSLYGLGLVSFIVLGALQAMYGPTFLSWQARYHVPASQLGLTVGLHFLSAIGATLLGGVWLQRWGYRRVFLVAGTLLATGSLGMAVSPRWSLVLLSASLIGGGFGGVNLGLTVLFGAGGPRPAAAALNLLSAMLGLGSFLGPLLVALFLPLGPAGAFLVPTLASLTLVGLVARLPLSAPDQPPGPAAALARSWSVVGFVLLFFLYVGSEAGVGSWEATYLAPGLGEAPAALWTSVFWGAILLGRLVAVPLSLWVSASRLVLGAILTSAGFLALSHILPLAPYTYALAGFTLAPIFPTSLVWLRHLFPNQVVPVTALVLVSAGLGGVAFPPLIGLWVEASSPTVIPTALTVIALSCAVVKLLLAYATPAG